eukprot:IDg871t1
MSSCMCELNAPLYHFFIYFSPVFHDKSTYGARLSHLCVLYLTSSGGSRMSLESARDGLPEWAMLSHLRSFSLLSIGITGKECPFSVCRPSPPAHDHGKAKHARCFELP